MLGLRGPRRVNDHLRLRTTWRGSIHAAAHDPAVAVVLRRMPPCRYPIPHSKQVDRPQFHAHQSWRPRSHSRAAALACTGRDWRKSIWWAHPSMALLGSSATCSVLLWPLTPPGLGRENVFLSAVSSMWCGWDGECWGNGGAMRGVAKALVVFPWTLC